MTVQPILLVGDVCIDFSLMPEGKKPKVRLGGVVHAARALWAAGISYSVAVSCPSYLCFQAKKYLNKIECKEFIQIAEIDRAPNVFIIQDMKEVGDQGYEDILRAERKFKTNKNINLQSYETVVIFPGNFSIKDLAKKLNEDANVTVDITGSMKKFTDLEPLKNHIRNIAISTSSKFFISEGKKSIAPLLACVKKLNAEYLLLKENRGGSRLFNIKNKNKIEKIPARLGETQNSVGVGDSFTAIFAALRNDKSAEESAWRGMQVATTYSSTTYVKNLKDDVRRELNINYPEIKELKGGTSLPWHDRNHYDIYFAAPDFTYIPKTEKDTINATVKALKYHNFKVRRPIKENGQISKKTKESEYLGFFDEDMKLLKDCPVVFAVPLNGDPGTLVEIGLAIQMKKPVITFDPYHENRNIMVMCGSKVYSSDLDICLNGLFKAISLLNNP